MQTAKKRLFRDALAHRGLKAAFFQVGNTVRHRALPREDNPVSTPHGVRIRR
jgi:heat shock protein HspQ